MLKVIFIISIFLLGLSSINKPHNFKSKSVTPLKYQGKAFFIAAQTGNSKLLSTYNKNLLKEFGVIHLLTPSGIHLSAILGIFLLILPRKLHFILFLSTLIFFLNFPYLYSLKRVLYFQLFRFLMKGESKNKLSFAFTFILDLICGGFSKSALSFSFSFLFWGTIIFSKPKLIYLNLFKAQLIAHFFSTNNLNALACIVNPTLTFLYSLLFPLFSFNYWIANHELLNMIFFDLHSLVLSFLHFLHSHFTFLEINRNPSLLVFAFIEWKRIHFFIFFMFFTTHLNITKHKNFEISYLYSLPHKRELISIGRSQINFLDIKCSKQFKGSWWKIKCKKKPSNFGGPIF